MFDENKSVLPIFQSTRSRSNGWKNVTRVFISIGYLPEQLWVSSMVLIPTIRYKPLEKQDKDHKWEN